MRYAERGWISNGSQEKGKEESDQEESHEEKVVFSIASRRVGPAGGRRAPGEFYAQKLACNCWDLYGKFLLIDFWNERG
jgi:hypothetical protein